MIAVMRILPAGSNTISEWFVLGASENHPLVIFAKIVMLFSPSLPEADVLTTNKTSHGT